MLSYMEKKKSFFICRSSISLLAAITLLWGICFGADARPKYHDRKQLFDYDWKFSLGDDPDASSIAFNDAGWRKLDLPHDWSIEGTVDPAHPMGNDGGYFPAGIGWYRKTFQVPSEYRDRKVGIYFEGVYMNSEVFVNGRSVGVRPYGYSSFYYDLTHYLRYGEKNTIAVRVDNSQQKNCRWYTGSGIYRHVWLMVTHPVHVAHWGVAVTTPEVSKEKALVQIKTTLKNETPSARRVTLTVELAKENLPAGREETAVELAANSSCEVTQTVPVLRPVLWSPATPQLYEARLTVKEAGEAKEAFQTTTPLDSTTETFGIRTLTYSPEEGLHLNGERIILNGGCLHHDNGCLGAAAYDRAEVRKAELMKAAGFNAARTSHNIPSEAFLHACDSLGLLVINESFDGWRDSKNKSDYSLLFDRWWQQDVEAMVLRDRNHPSIFCWSTGNEVIERKKLEVVTTAKKLADHVRRLDPTRPVTSALAAWDKDWEIYDPLAAVHDIVGYNYLLHRAPADHQRVPSRIIIQTESYPRDAFANWALVNDNDYIIGDFVWTAIDYLGESGIGRYYYAGESEGEHYERPHYPWHGAYCGDIDLTGWRKPISHYRDLLYNPGKKLYMAVREPDHYYGKIKETLWSVWPTWESWNWPGHEGKEIQVEVYSRYSKVRLYLNDKLLGEQPTGREQQFKAVFPCSYEPGILKAVGVDAAGMEVEKTLIKTAGQPARMKLAADRTRIKATGQDLTFVTVEILDKEGIVNPNANNPLSFEVKGAGVIVAAGNADLKDTDVYTSHQRKAWKGRAMVVIKSTRKAGKVTLRVTSPGVQASTLVIHTSK